MTSKMIFLFDDKEVYKEQSIEFTYVKGMSFSQKQKNVLSFHKSIQEKYPDKKILEVSTKSQNALGVSLSAFNLKLDDKYLECIFQSSKVFCNNIQFKEVLDMNPKDAKRYVNDKGLQLERFSYNGTDFPLEPKSMFYDYIYVLALAQHLDISKELVNYDIFTDIEFNEKKQYNCQARTCAIFCYIVKSGKIEYYLENLNNFKELYRYNSSYDLFSI